MNILFELNHPAHGHLFKNTIKLLTQKGHNVTVVIKEISVLKVILDEAGIEYSSLGKKGPNLLLKFLYQLKYIIKVCLLHRKKRFNLGIGVSVTLPLLSRISSMESIVLDDDDKKATPLFAMLAHKTATVLLRPAALKHEGLKANTIYYPGYHELAYLHPSVFNPDISVLGEQGLNPDDTFFLIRLVALKAHHDSGIRGISRNQLNSLIELLKPFGSVILTHEVKSDHMQGVEPLRINPSRLHHLMSFAKLVISDGQTMCSEAACMGVPSVRINDFVGKISYLDEIEKRWNLSFGFSPDNFDLALKKIRELAETNSQTFKNRRDEMVSNCIHVTEFLTEFIENYPASFYALKQNPAIQLQKP